MIINRALKRISWATTNWPGVPIDPDGLAHAVNFTGNLNPIIWVFNDESEPRNFSQCFDVNQPIIAFRTLNAIVAPSNERTVLSEEISNLYADIIIKLVNKPIGLDIEKHKDFDKRISFKKTNAIKYLTNNKKKFDLILIKQTIHFFNLREITKVLRFSHDSLEAGGVILILTLDTKNNEIPTFSLMKQKLNQSFKRDNLIWKKLLQLNIKKNITKFNFKVNVKKKII